MSTIKVENGYTASRFQHCRGKFVQALQFTKVWSKIYLATVYYDQVTSNTNKLKRRFFENNLYNATVLKWFKLVLLGHGMSDLF